MSSDDEYSPSRDGDRFGPRSSIPYEYFDFEGPDCAERLAWDPVCAFATAVLIILDSWHAQCPKPVLIRTLTGDATIELRELWPSNYTHANDIAPLLEAHGSPGELLERVYKTPEFQVAYHLLRIRKWIPECLISDDLVSRDIALNVRESAYRKELADMMRAHWSLVDYCPPLIRQLIQLADDGLEPRPHRCVYIPAPVWDAACDIYDASRAQVRYKQRAEVTLERFEKWKNDPRRFERPSDTPKARCLTQKPEDTLRWFPTESLRRRAAGSPSSLREVFSAEGMES
ncbi:hypothetical protein CYLTODRAFT_451632 [Cylindrobasidium torrendii FP15055 ss-10]|uniref:Uncharacterized protein n=1 Tax=Cylindrobasidium torrendii FP15055 ss-10 TaxID=1314674 RepID=A0A0D7BJ21_9AGAR|nr:hypothetical protein CYLTODRAFT_451632 [Cylindrobasidium torrendii FP15055 ss-10]